MRTALAPHRPAHVSTVHGRWQENRDGGSLRRGGHSSEEHTVRPALRLPANTRQQAKVVAQVAVLIYFQDASAGV